VSKLVIEGVFGLDGEYEADLSYFTNRELHQIKKQTGIRAGEFSEAFASGDNDVMVAFAVVILNRAGKEGAEELLWDAKAGAVTLVLDDEDDEDAGDGESGVGARPPEPPMPSGPESLPDAEPSTSYESEPSGEASPAPLELLVSDPSPTGFPRSATGAN
jgi:hypothetical protein